MTALLLAVFAIAVLPSDVAAQQAPKVQVAKSIGQYIHDIWDDNVGLPQNSVSTIIQDQDGYLWFGTDEGLVRFNGTRFDVYDKLNVEAFEVHSSVNRLYQDKTGRIWISLLDGGLIVLENGEFRRFLDEEGFGQKTVTDFAESPGGIFWIATEGSGLYAVDGDAITRFSAINLASDAVRAVDVTKDGTVWIGTRDGLFRNSRGRIDRFSTADGLWSNEVNEIAHDDDNVVWVGTQSGLNKFVDGEIVRVNESSIPGSEDDGTDSGTQVQSILAATDGVVWVGTYGNGVARFANGEWTSFDAKGGLSHDKILTVFEDREGSIWTGSEGGGLDRFRVGKITTYTTKEGLSHDFVFSVFEDDSGNQWFGSEGGGATRMSGTDITTYTRADGLTGDEVTSIAQDGNGTIWLGTLENGLNALTAKGKITHFTTANSDLPGDGINAMSRDADGNLLVGTDRGIAVYKGGKFESINLGVDESDNVLSILAARGGELWVGTNGAGLKRVSPFGITTFTTDDGLGGDDVTALHEDEQGNVWIGTYGGGLSRIKGSDITTYTSRDGLYNDVVYTIQEDDEGNLWMTCNKGLFRVSIAVLDSYDRGETSKIANTVYSINDGLKSNEFNGGLQPTGWKDSSGRLWFATVEGAAMVSPHSMPHNGTMPPVAIEKFLVEGELYSHADTLAPGTEKIEFEYAALTFINPEEVTYEYKLEGYDSDWTSAGPVRTATYTNLDPGEFTFRVRAANSDGTWNMEGASHSFYLRPFFYQTSAFWAFMVVLSTLFGGLLYWVRFRALKARQRELEKIVESRTKDLVDAKEQIEAQAESLKALDRFKTRFFNNISHEFRTPLTLTIGPLENALTGTYGSLGPAMRAQVEIMLRNSRRLLRLINQLLDLAKLESGKMALRTRPGNIVSFAEGIVYSFTAFAAERGIELRFESDEDVIEVYFDPEKIEKVLFNFLSNAVKFTPSDGKIIVRADKNDDANEVVLTVSDTGPGIPEASIPFLFDRYRQVDGTVSTIQDGTGIGLSLAKELVDLHSGRIGVESVVDQGSDFTFSLLLGTDHLSEDQIAKKGDTDDAKSSPQLSMAEMVVADPAEIGGSRSQLVFDESKIKPDAPVILIVDDNHDIRDYVRTCLYPSYRVFEASNGANAFEVLESIEPDLIVSDIMMPVMDGYEFANKLKNDPELNHIPVVFLTAKASTDRKVAGLEMGVDDYISKPFNSRELRARIGNLIKIRSQEKELVVLNENLEAKVESQLQLILQERTRYEDELILARDIAEESARLKSSILDNMSHEIRTPLTAILGYAQLLAREVPPEQSEFVKYIETGGKRLLDTLNAVLDLSRIESQELQIQHEPTDVCKSVADVAALFQPIATQKGLTLKTEFANSAIADLDSNALDRILNNLVGNAIKFTTEGSVTIGVSVEGDDVFIDVSDTGVGIGEDFRPNLFEAFKQESSGIARSHEGSGLGLAITKRLVELMNGTITVESEQGVGSTFTVSLGLKHKKLKPAGGRKPVQHALPPGPTPTGDLSAHDRGESNTSN